MKSFVILLMVIGICMVVVGYNKSNQMCPADRVEFRYIPRTFEQEQEAPTPVLSIFGKMFRDEDAWMKHEGYAAHQRTAAATADTDSPNLNNNALQSRDSLIHPTNT